MIGNGGTGSAFPAARFEREEIVERAADGSGFGSGRDQDSASLRQASPFAPEFLLLVTAESAFQIERSLAARRQQRPLVAIEIGGGHPRAPQNWSERCREWAIFRQELQQRQSRQRGIRGKVSKEGCDNLFSSFSINKRHAKRAIGMSQADQYR
jgi:hypothetical protein